MGGASVLQVSGSLQQRTLTALWLGSLVIGVVLWFPPAGFALFFTLLVLTAAWEWCGLAGIERGVSRLAYLVVMAVGMWLLWLWPQWQVWLFGLSALWWLLQTVRLMRVRRVDPVVGVQPLLLPVGLLVLLAPWAALVGLHRIPEMGPALVLFLLILVWTADSMAYFVGRRWGRAKLAPVLSPGKTRVGVYGAMGGAALCGLLFAWTQSLGLAETLWVLSISVLSALVSVTGDLYESLLKRRRGVKDSSRLLPGHGGLLDRIDSLTAAAPVFALGLTWALT